MLFLQAKRSPARKSRFGWLGAPFLGFAIKKEFCVCRNCFKGQVCIWLQWFRCFRLFVVAYWESMLFKAPLQFKKIIMFDSLLPPCRPGSECRFKARQPSRFGDGMQPLWVVLWIQLWIHLELLVSEFVWFESRFERLVKAIEPATP